ncbi:MAG: hypothetical protein Q9M92_11735 [Enterobacterales bacterium]|nr:hypothetical protein [Enterobacterales bacterium]
MIYQILTTQIERITLSLDDETQILVDKCRQLETKVYFYPVAVIPQKAGALCER